MEHKPIDPKIVAKHFGSQAKLAEIAGVKRAAVWMWVHESKQIPAAKCLAISAASGGRFSCNELRPDIFGPVANAAPAMSEAQ